MAAFVRFERPFDYSPVGAAWARSYASGWTILVPEDQASAAEAAGAGERVAREDIDPEDERVFPPAEKARR